MIMASIIDPIPHFAATYVEARDKFLAAAKAHGLPVTSHVHPTARGAAGEDLSMDVAVLGEGSATGMLLLISGTHGAEGFCGSGCQVALLHDADFVAAVRAAGVSIVFVHALNPYGFSHLHRTNEDNVDLNRNFRDFATPPVANAGYADVHGFIVPATWPPAPDNEARIGAYIARHGQKALQQAVSGGQCEFPDGLFYGGVRPAWSNTVLRSILREHGASRQRIGWIDFHTGLGPRGHGEKIYSGRNASADLARAKAWWGADVTSFFDGSSTSAALTGVNYNAAYDECPQAAFTGIALEYGTLSFNEVLQALRADQWRINHPDADPATLAAISSQVRDAFYGDADDWKATVYAQGRDASMKAVSQLAGKP
jgi:uncharacterized protein DUF2817